MRDYAVEFDNRVAFIRDVVKNSGAKGIIYGNSGGKDCTLVSMLCKAACDNTLGVIMPCGSSQNYGRDRQDALAVAEKLSVETRIVGLTAVRDALTSAINADKDGRLSSAALSNIAPRLRMTTLYAIAADENRLVAGTGNRSEGYMGYFTKWGDGAYDFNPISDLTVTEVYEFLRYLGAPECVIEKPPSAGLFEGQTDEAEMGVTYAAVDAHIRGEAVLDAERAVIERFHAASAHKRKMPLVYQP